MTKVVHRQMLAPRELSQQIPAPRAKARMQKPQGGGKFLVQIPGSARRVCVCVGGWLWMKLIPALPIELQTLFREQGEILLIIPNKCCRRNAGYPVHGSPQKIPKVRHPCFDPPCSQLRLLLTQRFLTFRCVPCLKIKDTDDVLPVKEGPQLP